MTPLSNLLADARRRKGYSLRQAAALIGISHTYLSALEKGYDPRTGSPISASQDVLLRLCKAYDLDTSEVLPTIRLERESDLYEYAARRIAALKKTDPKQYARLLTIITSGGK